MCLRDRVLKVSVVVIICLRTGCLALPSHWKLVWTIFFHWWDRSGFEQPFFMHWQSHKGRKEVLSSGSVLLCLHNNREPSKRGEYLGGWQCAEREVKKLGNRVPNFPSSVIWTKSSRYGFGLDQLFIARAFVWCKVDINSVSTLCLLVWAEFLLVNGIFTGQERVRVWDGMGLWLTTA